LGTISSLVKELSACDCTKVFLYSLLQARFYIHFYIFIKYPIKHGKLLCSFESLDDMLSKFVLAQDSTSLLGTYMIKDNFSMDTVNILHTLLVIKLFHLRLMLI